MMFSNKLVVLVCIVVVAFLLMSATAIALPIEDQYDPNTPRVSSSIGDPARDTMPSTGIPILLVIGSGVFTIVAGRYLRK